MTTNNKVLTLLKKKKGLTKKGLSLSLGISRPTLDSRIRHKNKWKTLEEVFIAKLFSKWVTNQIRNVS